MNHIKLFAEVGAFAENKDIARKIRLKQIIPSINKGEEVITEP